METLSSPNPPWWVIEVSIDEHQPRGITINPHLVETFELIYNAGYKVRTFDTTLRPIELDEFKAIVVSGKNHLNTHNFLCVPAAMEEEAGRILLD